ncbi:adenosylcobinamide-GDP ribazoletransferase [Breoghania sp. L-A4]|uniref:adenosylcobinamide-GDP ribazoletransferase n=1 Tax=Breoghania sp. L-A4 TaxID=2304600 RepID=UPI000E360409|nr:adenosylcobinamide-GDP ribazoletransferase [Breoghania sp. L-A4]AXS40106.1 adenosylcobinamide-GDP ribazoletransferase [Breoghania sp. L-A4]
MKTQGNPLWSALAPWLADIAAAMRFFSRLPVPRLGPDDDPAAMPDFTRASRATPVAGALIALPGALLLLALSLTALPPLVIAALTLCALIATSGGLHEDGLADVADGFFGAHTAEKRLDIMRDSRVGTYGVLALAMALILAAGLLETLLIRHGAWATALALVGAGAISRAVALWPWVMLPCARPGGLAAQAGQPGKDAVVGAFVLGAVLTLPQAVTIGLAHWLAALGASGLATLGTGSLARAKIGGHTGDVIGAAQQLAALAFLIGLLMFA